MSTEAMKMAIEALEGDPNAMVEVSLGHWDFKRDLAIKALRRTLSAQSPADCGEAGHDEGRCGNASCSQPVAWRYKSSKGHWRYVGHPLTPRWEFPLTLNQEPLYAAAQAAPSEQCMRDMLAHYSQYANVQSVEALQYQKRIADLQRELSAAQAAQPAPQRPMTADQIDRHIGADEGDRDAVTAIVREVEAWHGITAAPTADKKE